VIWRIGDYPRNRDDLVALAKELRRPLASVYALSSNANPIMVDQPYRLSRARWFFDLFEQFEMPVPFHIRRAFYRLVSQETEILQYNDVVFQNTIDCFNTLCDAGRDARYLSLISTDDIIDRRNPAPVINFRAVSDTEAHTWAREGDIARSAFGIYYAPPTYTLPETRYSKPTIGRPYHLEIWIEKSTANDILLPIGEEYGINVCTFVGEVTATACKDLVDRAIKSERPVRILHVTDFDPASRLTMSVATAVKIDFIAKKSGHDLDIRLEPVALTEEQCSEYQLPRTPLKDSDRRTAGFEARFGTGATELDALEALHPGALRQILIDHIERYYDPNLDSEVEDATERNEGELSDIDDEVHEAFADEIADIERQRRRIAAVFDRIARQAIERCERIERLARARRDRALELWRAYIQRRERRAVRQIEDMFRRMRRQLESEIAELDFEWPEPAEAGEADDPLYDSTRRYIDQVDRFREHQGKSDDDATLSADTQVTKTCIECGVSFSTNMRHRNVCTPECQRNQTNRARREKVSLRQAKDDKSDGAKP
jgi:hypothetical protein